VIVYCDEDALDIVKRLAKEAATIVSLAETSEAAVDEEGSVRLMRGMDKVVFTKGGSCTLTGEQGETRFVGVFMRTGTSPAASALAAADFLLDVMTEAKRSMRGIDGLGKPGDPLCACYEALASAADAMGLIGHEIHVGPADARDEATLPIMKVVDAQGVEWRLDEETMRLVGGDVPKGICVAADVSNGDNVTVFIEGCETPIEPDMSAVETVRRMSRSKVPVEKLVLTRSD
jgi:hypothetical protein